MEFDVLSYHIALAAAAVFVYVTTWFLISRIVRRNDVADVAWGPGIALVGLIALLLAPAPDDRLTIMSALVFLWGVRLAMHVWHRTMNRSEDVRYATWRRTWGRWFVPRSYLQVFILQGLLMLVVAYPLLHVSAFARVPFGLFDVIGLVIWLVGFLYETIADMQLRRFMADRSNAGKIFTSGLFKYSRHPNYFGESLQWWGLATFALATPYGVLAFVSPVVVTLLLLYVSGIPMLEAHLQHKPGYRAYASRTNALIPWCTKVPSLVEKAR